MDKPHLDPNTNLLTEEYMAGIGEFMALVQRQSEANTGMLRCHAPPAIIIRIPSSEMSLIWCKPKKAKLLASQPMNSDDDSTAASTNFCRLQINEMVEQTVPKKKGRLVGLARRVSSCPSSSQTPYTDPMIMEQLQNKDERIEALETQNATILAELADQKKTNNEIIDKKKRLFLDEFQ
uniref:Uncharacterized protein n=1 Tax=Brassica oleracea var. oleracea TaxID=109376 RepID=A0A0D3B8K9_BRAOL